MSAIEIIEVSPRDGLQNEKTIVSTADKIRLIERSIAAGARRIEAVSFVHPRIVPAMADAEAVMAGVPRGGDVSYIGLVLNETGMHRAARAGVDEVNFVLPVTDEFAAANQNSSVEAIIAQIEASAPYAVEAGIGVSVTLAVAFGCPYRGEVSVDEVERVARAVLAVAPVDELALADTIGCGVPGQTSELFARMRKITDAPLRGHFHETRHTAIANAFAAIGQGVLRLDSSVGGLGGCPFAPGAAGNVSTEDLVWALGRDGHTTTLSAEIAAEAGRWISGLVGGAPRSGLSSAGAFPPRRP